MCTVPCLYRACLFSLLHSDTRICYNLLSCSVFQEISVAFRVQWLLINFYKSLCLGFYIYIFNTVNQIPTNQRENLPKFFQSNYYFVYFSDNKWWKFHTPIPTFGIIWFCVVVYLIWIWGTTLGRLETFWGLQGLLQKLWLV